MKKVGVLLFWAGWCGVPVFAQGTPGSPLDEAKRVAIENNPEIASLDRALSEARAQKQRFRSAFLPRLGLGTGVDTELAEAGRGTSALYFAYGQWNVFRGFEDAARSNIAQAEIDKAAVRLEKAKFRLGLDVESQFYLYAFKTLALRLTEQALEVNQTQIQLAKVRRESGLLSGTDLLEYELREARLQSDTVNIELDRRLAKTALMRLLGDSASRKDVELPSDLGHWHVVGTLEEHLQRASRESEPVQIASEEVRIAELESRQAKAKWLPTVDLEARAGRIPYGDRYLSDETTFRGNVLLRWELFSGTETIWLRREMELKKQKLEKSLRAAQLSTGSEVTAAWTKIKSTETRVHLEERNEARAKKYYASVIAEYKRGVRNSTDVRAAAEILFDASLRRASFKYDFLNQKIELERALGGPVQLVAKPEVVTRIDEDHSATDGGSPEKPEREKEVSP